MGGDRYVHFLNCGNDLQIKTSQIIYLKYVEFIVCQLNFNKTVKNKNK